MTRFFILAGTHQQAQQIARAHDLQRSEWAYVTSRESILGCWQGTLWLTGNWHDRPDALDLVSLAATREFRVFELIEKA